MPSWAHVPIVMDCANESVPLRARLRPKKPVAEWPRFAWTRIRFRYRPSQWRNGRLAVGLLECERHSGGHGSVWSRISRYDGTPKLYANSRQNRRSRLISVRIIGGGWSPHCCCCCCSDFEHQSHGCGHSIRSHNPLAPCISMA